ncbi:methyltransferase domain-containing protein [Streptosporangium sp. NPDC023963]|uniref:SAM-dependent methyltransferase n=1 Tax=Streptosporangium sp. NPDC023963 TaxID=3155608 RepID=UPI003443AE0F
MSLRFHEIAEGGHRILNPFTHDKLMLLGEVARLRPGARLLDLCCGKAEMLCQWSLGHGIKGVGVDISDVFLDAARARAEELGVADRVRLEKGDAGAYRAQAGAFDVVSCLGATWIGGGLEGTVKLMLPALKDDGILLVGEPYWSSEPPAGAYESLGFGPDDFTSLAGTFDRFEAAGVEVLEMVLADQDSWDRYMASQWWTLSDWLRDNPEDPDAGGVRDFLERSRRSHVEYGRRYLGWGVFVARRR